MEPAAGTGSRRTFWRGLQLCDDLRRGAGARACDDLLAPAFASRRGFDGAFKLAVYSYTPFWLAGIFLLAPGLRFLVLAGFYGVYLLWTGLPLLMQTPGPKLPAYAAATVACGCALTLIIAATQHALFGLSRFEARYAPRALTAPSVLAGMRAANSPWSAADLGLRRLARRLWMQHPLPKPIIKIRAPQPSPDSGGGCGSHCGLSGGQYMRMWK